MTEIHICQQQPSSGSVTKEMAESEQQYELLEAAYLLLYDLIEDSINEHSEV